MNDKGDNSDKKNINPNLQHIAGEIFKRAVTLGAGAYVTAEDRVSKTLNSMQAPMHLSKSVLKDLLDSFIANYSIQVSATVNFVPKSKEAKRASSEAPDTQDKEKST